jgi:hypothetical protein
MRRLSAFLILIAFVFSTGGHWYVLQGVAWTKMVGEFSEHAPLVRAIKMAVSGQYPCKMCKVIAEKKQQEEQSQYKLPTIKKDFVSLQPASLLQPVIGPLTYAVVQMHFGAGQSRPSIPPPRAA